jgi:hypothetical protein
MPELPGTRRGHVGLHDDPGAESATQDKAEPSAGGGDLRVAATRGQARMFTTHG